MRILCLLFLLCFTGFASEIKLKERLAEACPGSYLVIEQNKTFTFLHIHSRSEKSIVIEEVSIPAACFARRPMPWKVWFEQGAPGHTSWIMSQVNLETGVFEETFSFTHRGWIDMSDSNLFLTTLLNLHFKEISQEGRRRVGSVSGHSKADRRPIWNPRLIVDGHIVSNTSFYAYKARWPSDGTELARKYIEIYLPVSNPDNPLCYPSYFPYWLEVDGKMGSAKARVIDSGMEALSPKGELPRRAPQLMGEAQIEEEGLIFHLKSPAYFHEFMILAETNGSFFGNILPIPCTTLSQGELVSLHISKEELNKLAQTGNCFRVTISPKEDPSLSLESTIVLNKIHL